MTSFVSGIQIGSCLTNYQRNFNDLYNELSQQGVNFEPIELDCSQNIPRVTVSENVLETLLKNWSSFKKTNIYKHEHDRLFRLTLNQVFSKDEIFLSEFFNFLRGPHLFQLFKRFQLDFVYNLNATYHPSFLKDILFFSKFPNKYLILACLEIIPNLQEEHSPKHECTFLPFETPIQFMRAWEETLIEIIRVSLNDDQIIAEVEKKVEFFDIKLKTKFLDEINELKKYSSRSIEDFMA